MPAPAQSQLMEMYHLMHARFGDLHWWPAESPFEVIVGAVLTQNTAWGNVEKAIANLRTADLLTARRLHALGPAGIAPLIRPAGYFNIKARRLWNVLDYLVARHGGMVENMQRHATEILREELLAVNGVGRETADSILLYALHRPIFVVDAYTQRILKRHGLAPESADYDALQKLFHNNLPANAQLYNEFHAQIVMIGKHHCKPTPRCESCPLRELLPEGGHPGRP